MTSIRIVDLEKRFGELRAISDINLEIEKASFLRCLALLAVARRHFCGPLPVSTSKIRAISTLMGNS